MIIINILCQLQFEFKFVCNEISLCYLYIGNYLLVRTTLNVISYNVRYRVVVFQSYLSYIHDTLLLLCYFLAITDYNRHSPKALRPQGSLHEPILFLLFEVANVVL